MIINNLTRYVSKINLLYIILYTFFDFGNILYIYFLKIKILKAYLESEVFSHLRSVYEVKLLISVPSTYH